MNTAIASEAEVAADALGAAINGRDVAAIRALYADDIIVWHGSTNQAQTKEENSNLLASVFSITSELEYVDIRRHAIADGIVQQHRLVGTFDNGRPMPDLNACLVIKVQDARILSIDEYFDGSIYAEVWERIAALTTN
jgi:ketosteroid isomerase-like protein